MLILGRWWWLEGKKDRMRSRDPKSHVAEEKILLLNRQSRTIGDSIRVLRDATITRRIKRKQNKQTIEIGVLNMLESLDWTEMCESVCEKVKEKERQRSTIIDKRVRNE